MLYILAYLICSMSKWKTIGIRKEFLLYFSKAVFDGIL